MKLFGTDGIRGLANQEPMTAVTALKVAMAAGSIFRKQIYNNQRHPLVVIGKDTRLSGYLIEPALTAGFIAMGMDVVLVGPMPTPAIAMLTKSMRANLGVMISASHNPYEDNGIKFFDQDGQKLSDKVEKNIEAQFKEMDSNLVPSKDLGRAKRLDDAAGRYIEFAKNSFPSHLRLDGLKVVVDCAHGAAYKVAPIVLRELGADVIPIHVEPNGMNINDHCGATYPKIMCEAVLAHQADLGIALDGDADRVILSDEKGHMMDGDQIMALIAGSWLKTGQLQGDGVVATVMSNMGLEDFLKEKNLQLYRAGVGDRHVVEMMRQKNCNLGGEQSGHMIMSDYATTGDGLIAALQVLAILAEEKRSASQVSRCFKPYPQTLKNIRFPKGQKPLEDEKVQEAIRAAEKSLKNEGRILVRPSGTEPLIRVMVEAKNEQQMNKIADHLVAIIQDVLAA